MPRHNRTCPVCQKVYSTTDAKLRFGRGSTCSRECSYTFRGANSRTRVEVKCRNCGVSFDAHACRIKRANGRNYCSSRCVGLGAERDPAFLSARGARTYAEGKTLAFPASEKALLERLRGLGLTVVHQYVVASDGRSFCVDFYIADTDTFVELDGLDAHGRKRAKPRDAAVDAAIAAMGKRVIRVPDTGDTDAAVAAIIAA